MNLEALKNLKKKVVIETEDGGIELFVKGYSLADLTKLLALHASVMSELYMSLDRKDDYGAMYSIIRAVPAFINDAICLALSLELTEENHSVVECIPATDQMKILTIAGKQTFKSEKDVKEFMAVAGELVGAAVSGVSHQQQSNNGSGNSASKSPSSKRTVTPKRGATQSA